MRDDVTDGLSDLAIAAIRCGYKLRIDGEHAVFAEMHGRVAAI
jgi:hypothetical protein